MSLGNLGNVPASPLELALQMLGQVQVSDDPLQQVTRHLGKIGKNITKQNRTPSEPLFLNIFDKM